MSPPNLSAPEASEAGVASNASPSQTLLPEGLLILMYHRVAWPPAGAQRGLYTTPDQFAGQLAALTRAGAAFTTFSALAKGAVGAEGPPEARGPGHPVILTFDDGTQDLYRHALPFLVRARIPAVVYPVVGDLGKRGVVWPENADPTPVDLLNEAELREMATAGIEFGSHLMEHRRAPGLDAEALATQLSASKTRLEALTGAPCVSLAYPFGAYGEREVAAAHAAGYRYAVTTESGVCPPTAHPLRLPRVAVKGTRWHHPWRFRRRVLSLLRG